MTVGYLCCLMFGQFCRRRNFNVCVKLQVFVCCKLYTRILDVIHLDRPIFCSVILPASKLQLCAYNAEFTDCQFNHFSIAECTECFVTTRETWDFVDNRFSRRMLFCFWKKRDLSRCYLKLPVLVIPTSTSSRRNGYSDGTCLKASLHSRRAQSNSKYCQANKN